MKSNSRTKLSKIITSIFVCLLCLFTFSACSSWPWNEDDTPASSTDYDSLGRRRIASVDVMHEYVPANGVVDENTGSFYWDLSYYLSIDKTPSNDYYLGEVDSSAFAPSYIADNCRWFEKNQVVANVTKFIITDGETTTEYTSIQKSSWYTFSYDDNNTTLRMTRVDSFGEANLEFYLGTKVDNGTPLSDGVLSNFKYSYYTINLSGINYQVKVDVNRDKLVVDYSNKYQLFSAADNTELDDIFTISYRIAGTQNWTTIGENNYKMLSVEYWKNGGETTNKMIVRYNPILTKGSTSRNIRLQTNNITAFSDKDDDKRASSVSSSPLAFNVYMLTFNPYSLNTSTYDYNLLTYDKTKYYFVTDNQTGTNSAMVGYFVEGRIVRVYRSMDKDGDYALQPWTVNAKPSYSYALEDYLPEHPGGYNLTTTLPNDASHMTCLSSYSINYANAKEIQIVNTETQLKTSDNYYREIIDQSDEQKTVGELSVVACNQTASRTFYGNFAKVKNFVLSGTVHDSDSYMNASSGTQSTTLNNVNIYVWSKVEFYVKDNNGNYVFVDGTYKPDTNKNLTHYKSNPTEAVARYIKSESPTEIEYYFEDNENGQFVKENDIYRVATQQDKDNNVQLYSRIYLLLDEYIDLQHYSYSPHNADEDVLLGYFATDGAVFAFNANQANYFAYMQNIGKVDVYENEIENNCIGAYFNASYVNSAFYIKGLTHDCYISFEKTSLGDNYYTFYSASMSKLDEDDSNSIYVLSPEKTNMVIGDRTNNLILGTKYETNHQTNVNLFVTKNGTTEQIDTLSEDIPYQVISTTTEETDAYGYTTSRVIISILLPSNYTLTAYNFESVNSIGQVVYVCDTDETGYILCNVGYDETTRKATYTYYYTKPTANIEVTSDSTLNYLYYNGNLYQFSHRDTSLDQGTIYNNYYYSFVDANGTVLKTIKRSVAGANTAYTLYEYSYIDPSNISLDTSYQQNGTTVSVGFSFNYNSKQYNYANTNNSSIDVVATAFDTGLDYEDNENGNRDIYVYYNIGTYTQKASGDTIKEYYYVGTLGKRIAKALSDTDDDNNYLYTYYFDKNQINKDTPNVKLGSEILENQNHYEHFIQAVGGTAAIFADSYYYTKKLGEPTKLLISQYVNTDTTETTSTESVYFHYVEDENGSYIKDGNNFVIDDDQAAHASETHYSSVVYSGIANSRVDKYNHGIGGLLLFATANSTNSGEYKNQPIKLIYDQVNNGFIYLCDDIENLTLSTAPENANQSFVLYSINGNSYEPKTLPYNEANSNFFEQQTNNTIIENAIIAHIDDSDPTSTPFIVERKSYKYQTPETFYLTPVYNIYTFSPTDLQEEGAVTNIELYCYRNGNDYEFYKNAYSTLTKVDDNDVEQSYMIVEKLTEQEKANFLVYDAVLGLWKINNCFVNTTNGKTYYNYCIRKYYEQQTSGSNTLGTQYFAALGTVEQNNFNMSVILSNATVKLVDCDYEYYYVDNNNTEQPLEIKTVELTRKNTPNNIVRKAVLQSNKTVNVHLLGKLVLLGDGTTKQYPNFDYYLQNDSQSIISDQNTYFDVDYTTVNGVIQCFPGVTIIDGAPYVNPVLSFEVVHKANEQSVLNVGIELVDAYYVEVITNAITSSNKDFIYDFSTVTFKDTVTNLSSNNYIDKMYYVLFGDTLGSIVAYTIEDNKATAYLGGTPLTIQNIGLNDGDNQVYTSGVKENGIYFQPLYYRVTTNIAGAIAIDGKYYKPLTTDQLVIWSSSSKSLNDIPIFDVHSYYLNDDGMITLSSDGDQNTVCSQVDDLFISGTGDTSDTYDYNEVLIGGTVSAYRVSANEIKNASSTLQAYTFEDAISLGSPYNSKDAYFLTEKEGVVLVASPIVSISDDVDDNILYRFKRWAVYSRYNSEVLYKNQDVLQSNNDVENAVMRFTSKEAGYFVFMPIYQRVYTINIGSAVTDGAINMGGDISVIYDGNTGSSINLDVSNYDNLRETTDDGKNGINSYFIEYLPIVVNGQERYYYSNLEIQPMLYFTGNLSTDTQEPIFEKIQVIKYGDNYYKADSTINQSSKLNVIDSYEKPFGASSYKPGLVKVNSYNTQYFLPYTKNGEKFDSKAFNYDSYIYTGASTTTLITDALIFGYTVNYYDDSNNDQSHVVYYNESNKTFYSISKSTLYRNNRQLANKTPIDIILENGEPMAKITTKTYNSIAIKTFDSFISDTYFKSILGSLYAGELYSYEDENGNEIVNTSLQFKTSYFDRDTSIILSANANVGYRLEGWYLAEYNPQTNSWIVGDKSLDEEINTNYSDIIRDVEENKDSKIWYYKTAYYDHNLEEGKRIYYYDEDLSTPATVPNSMLKDVCGEYYKDSLDHYMPLYKKATSSTLYTDPKMTDGTEYNGSHETISHYSAIYSLVSMDGQKQTTSYYLGQNKIYLYKGNFYRSTSTSNMTFKENKLYIATLHGNVRVVAKFVECYQALIFTEDSNKDNIQVVAVYYNGTRSDSDGQTFEDICTKDSDGSYIATGIGFNDKDKNGNYLFDNSFINTASQNYYIAENKLNNAHRNTVLFDGQITKRIGVLVGGNMSPAEPEDLNLINMNFDINTSMYIVVRVHYDKALNVHSLGMNSSHVLVPVMYPSTEFITQNMAADESVRQEYYYYIFKIKFDHDLSVYSTQATINGSTINDSVLTHYASDKGNYNPEYLTHIMRGKNIVSDVLSGKYSAFYSNIFNFYVDDVKIFNAVNNKITLTDNYKTLVATKLQQMGYSIDSSNDLLTRQYDNLIDFFDNIRETYKIDLSVSCVMLNNLKIKNNYPDLVDKKLVSYNDILSCINAYFELVLERGLLNVGGSTNFINLSSIPVYTYTTKVQVIDSVNANDEIIFSDISLEPVDENQNKIPLIENGLYARGGSQGKTYIGIGTEQNVNRSFFGSSYPKHYMGTNSYYIFQEDYALAENSIIVLDGLKTELEVDNEQYFKVSNGKYYIEKDGVKYIFTGWYEQKKVTDKTDKKLWSNMQLMSLDPKTPFESAAYADTNIIALFERAAEIEFTFAKDTMTINLNSNTDSLGNSITEQTSGNITTIRGTWTITSLLSLDITPSGSYRITDNWNSYYYDAYYDSENPSTAININDGKNSKDYFDFYQEDLSGFLNMNLVKTINAQCTVYDLLKLHNDNPANAANCKRVSVDIGTKQVILTYIHITGYLSYSTSSAYSHNGTEFVLFEKIGDTYTKIVETKYDSTKNSVSNYVIGFKDNAQRSMQVEIIDSTNLAIYGYFDISNSDKLFVSHYAVQGATPSVKKWSVNAYSEYTESMQPTKIALDTVSFTDYSDRSLTLQDVFKVSYYYNLNNLTLNDGSDTRPANQEEVDTFNGNFNLNNNNYVYLLSAIIESTNQLGVEYITVDTVENYNDTKTLDGTTFSQTGNGNISWVGARTIDVLSASIGGNQIEIVVEPDSNNLVYVCGTLPVEYSLDEHKYIVHNNIIIKSSDVTITTRTDQTLTNGAYPLVDQVEYEFGSGTRITLSNTLDFYTNANKIYKFIGWFEYDTQNDKYSISSNTNTIDVTGGKYYAVFALLTELAGAHTYTTANDGTELSVDNNGTISVESNYVMHNNSVENAKSFEINSFCMFDNKLYFVIGSNIKVTAVADNGYLIKDIEKENQNTHNTVVLETNTNKNQTLETTFVPENEVVELKAIINKGITARVVNLYYDSIDMTSVAEYLTTLPKIATPTVKLNNDNVYVNARFKDYTFVAGDTIELSAENTDLFGLIGFYIDGQKIEKGNGIDITYTQRDNGTALYRITGLVLNESVNIEARFTRFVRLYAYSAYEKNDDVETIPIIPTIKYVDPYKQYTQTDDPQSGSTITIDGNNGPKVLSGTVVNLSVQEGSGYAFKYWDYLQNETYPLSINISSQKTYDQTIKFDGNIDDKDNQNDKYYAIFVTSRSLNITKVIDSISLQDEAHFADHDANKPDEQMLALLDVKVSYTDIYGNPQTIILGTSKNIENIMYKAKTRITIETQISESTASRYGYYIDSNLGMISNERFYYDSLNVELDVYVHFYAKRTITLIRTVNNQEMPMPTNQLEVRANTIPIPNNQSKYVIENFSTNDQLTILAQHDDSYEFAGFYINGSYTSQGYLIKNSSYQYKAIKIESGTNGVQQRGSEIFYSTNDADITVIAAYHTCTKIVPYIVVDGKPLDKDNSLTNLFSFVLYGNKLTQINDDPTSANYGLYNTTLQAHKITSGIYEKYMSGNNLALISSCQAGYQFAGFYYIEKYGQATIEDCKDNMSKLDAMINENAAYFGNSLTALIDGDNLELGKTYYVVARYWTAFSITQQISQYDTVDSDIKDISSASMSPIIPVKAIGSGNSKSYFVWENVEDYNVYLSAQNPYVLTNQLTYSYPAMSTNLIGLFIPSIGGYTNIGCYFNGKYIAPVENAVITYGNNNYYVFDISEFVKTAKDANDFENMLINNIVVDIRYAKNVEFVVRIGVDNTNDITKVQDIDFSNLSIDVSIKNELINLNQTKTYTKNDSNSYWNTTNNSLYINCGSHPIGTTVSVTISGDIDQTTGKPTLVREISSDNSQTLLFNGWFMYENSSVAQSSAVINYTTNCEFNLTGKIDIVAQFYETDTQYTTDQQLAFKFVGNDFVENQQNYTLFSQLLNDFDQQDDNYDKFTIANALADAFKNMDAETPVQIEQIASGNYTISLSPVANTNGLVWSVTYKGKTKHYLFTGWYQQIKGSHANTYLHLSNVAGLDYSNSELIIPHELDIAPNIVAEFVEIIEIHVSQNVANTLLYNEFRHKINYIIGTDVINTTEANSTTKATNGEVTIYNKLDANGNLFIHTLFDSYYQGKYSIINGYQYDENNYDQNVWISIGKKDSDGTFDAKTSKTMSNLEFCLPKPEAGQDPKPAEYDENKNIVKNVYRYSVEQTEMNVEHLSLVVNQSQNTNTSTELNKKVTSHLALASLDGKNINKVATDPEPEYIHVNDYLDLDESNFDENKTIKLSTTLVSPNEDKTLVVITVVCIYPNGTTQQFVVDKDKFSDAIEGLPVGTHITISINTISCVNETIKSIVLRDLDNNEDENLDTNTQELSYVVTLDSPSKIEYVITFANIYTLSLEENDIDQGTVNLEYVPNVSDATTSAEYNVEIKSKDDNQFNDVKISFTIDDNLISTTLLTLLNKLNESTEIQYKNLTQAISLLESSDTATIGNWSIEYDANHNLIIIKYTDVIEYVKLTLNVAEYHRVDNPNGIEYCAQTDALNFAYIKNVKMNYVINTNVSIFTEYLHVANVHTYYVLETVDMSSATYTSSVTGETQLVYVFDYQFCTTVNQEILNDVSENAENYIIINKLNTLYSIIENPDYSLYGYVYVGSKLKFNATSMGVNVVNYQTYKLNVSAKIDNQDSIVVEWDDTENDYVYKNDLNTYVLGLNKKSHNLNSLTVVWDENENDYVVVLLEQANSIVEIKAILIQKLNVKIIADTNFYDKEIGITDDLTESYFGTPSEYIKLYENGEETGTFAESTEEDKSLLSSVGLNQSNNITVYDEHNYYSFNHWEFKYDGKYIATLNEDKYERFTADYASVMLGINFLVYLVEQIKLSADFDALDTDEFVKYSGQEISFSKFEFIACMNEEVVEIVVNYDHPGETFILNLGSAGQASELTAELPLYDSTDAEHTVGKATRGTVKYLFAQFEIDATDDSPAQNKLVIAYAKTVANLTNFSIIATSYQSLSGQNIARRNLLAEHAGIREVCYQQTNRYSNTSYLKYTGIVDYLNNNYISNDLYPDALTGAICTSTMSGILHSKEFKLTTSNLYLVELSRAIFAEGGLNIDPNSYLEINGMGKTLKLNSYMLDNANTNYGVLSILVEEGTIVNINIHNEGSLIYKSTPESTSYRLMAISHTLMASDVFESLLENEHIYSYDAIIDEWSSLFEIDNDGESKTYTPLKQYSQNYIPNAQTTYSFIANKNTSIFADHIGLFKEHKEYISVVIGADKTTQFEYDNKESSATYNYRGENFVITISPKDTPVIINKSKDYLTKIETLNTYDFKELFDLVNGDDKQTKEFSFDGRSFVAIVKKVQEDEKTIFKLEYVSGMIPTAFDVDKDGYIFTNSKIRYTLADNKYTVTTSAGYNVSVNNTVKYDREKEKISITQQSYQIAIGIINNRVVNLAIMSINKYGSNIKLGTDDKNKMNVTTALAQEYGAICNPPTEESTGYFTYGFLNNTTGLVFESAYIGWNDNTIDDKNNNLYQNIKGTENIKLYADSSNCGNGGKYSFYGFMIISQNSKLKIMSNANNTVQNLSNEYGYNLWNAKLLKAYYFEETTKGNRTFYWINYSNLSGNEYVLAVYQPKISILNIKKYTYDENLITTQFNPDPDSDEETPLGRIYADSLIIDSSTTSLDLKFATNGYTEYKGMTYTNTNSKIGAVYSIDGKIAYSHDTAYTGSQERNKDEYLNTAENLVNSIIVDNLNTEIEYTKDSLSTNIGYYYNENDDDITEGITVGMLTKNKLFTKVYSTPNSRGLFDHNTASISYATLLFPQSITDDVIICVYFTSIYYTIDLTLSEFQTGHGSADVKNNDNPNLIPTAYVAYSEATRNDENWKNPTATENLSAFVNNKMLSIGFVGNEKTIGNYLGITQTSGTVGQYFGIDEKDPYIYTWYDNNGNLLSNPIKVESMKVNIPQQAEIDAGIDYLTLSGGNVQPLFTRVVARESNKEIIEEATVKYDKYQPMYFETKIDNIYDYVTISDGIYKLKNHLFSIQINDSKIDSGDLVSSNVAHDFDFKIYTLKNIAVGKLATATVIFDFTPGATKAIEIMIKIVADGNTGLPGVAITSSNNSANDGAITFGRIGTVDDDIVQHEDEQGHLQQSYYSEFVLKNSPSGASGSSINDFSIGNISPYAVSGQFFGNAFGPDENGNFVFLKDLYTDLTLNLQIGYMLASKSTQAVIELDGDDSQISIDITNPVSSTIKVLGQSYDTSLGIYNASVDQYLWNIFEKDRQDRCIDDDNLHYRLNRTNNEYSFNDQMLDDLFKDFIDAYDLFIVKNMQVYLDALQDIADKNLYDKAQIAKLMGEILAFNPGAFNVPDYESSITLDATGYNQIQRRKDAYLNNLPTKGTIFDYINSSKQDFITALRCGGYYALAYRLENNSDDLTFTRQNLFKNFKNSIAAGYYGNSVTYGDGIITVTKLTEHIYPHTVDYVFGDGVWDEDERGYIYLPKTTTTWDGFSYAQSNGTGRSTYYTNDFNMEAESYTLEVHLSFGKRLVNYLSGIFNRGKKYAGSYTLVSHAGLAPTATDIVDSTQKLTQFTTTTKIDIRNTDDARIRTANMDVCHSNVLVKVITTIVIAVGVFGLLASGPLGLLIASFIVIDGIISITDPNEQTMINAISLTISNLDF